MTMKFPEFRSDQEMADWFEANDISARDLEPASEVVVSSNLSVRIIGHGFADPSRSSVASAAPTEDDGSRNRLLVLN